MTIVAAAGEDGNKSGWTLLAPHFPGDTSGTSSRVKCEAAMSPLLRCRRSSTTFKAKVLLAFALVIWLLNHAGIIDFLLETPYSKFTYPLEVNTRELIRVLDEGGQPPYSVLNQYERYRFKIRNEYKCRESRESKTPARVKLLLVVKSALSHRDRREAIRHSWGFEKRFSDVPIRCVFVLGVNADDPATQDAVDSEYALHGDLVQADFVDSYYNNTIKMMQGFRWVVDYCSSAEFVLFVDDDYYVSVKNLLKFVRNPWGFSAVAQEDDEAPQRVSAPDGRLWAGYVFEGSWPMRHRWSKWYLSLSEYPYSRFPPYVTAGAFVLSQPALKDLYRVARYTRQFRFDDIFLGIVALKARLMPLHSDAFRFWGKPSDRGDFVGLIAAHGFQDPVELVRVWEQQRGYNQA
uniref:Hexosyltransferase n=1 Tax=Ixodes ricinus TaxID=34613 RepID=A0A131XUF2_IXORI